MKIFEFLKQKPKFEEQISALNNIRISDDQTSIEIGPLASKIVILKMLNILRLHKIAFSLFDNLYPSKSDTGAYISYSQEQNDSENTWSMTLGNHGWSGGIYTIDDNNISIQIKNLISLNLMNRINISNVQFFKYDKENIDNNLNQNSLIYGIHSNLEKVNSDYLIFGKFTSDKLGGYNIYKLTNTKLFIDKSKTWHSKRHSKDGYIFICEKTNDENFKLAKSLLSTIPLKLLSQKWDGFYTTGGKDENKIIIGFGNSDFKRTITFDNFTTMTENLPIEIKVYLKEIEYIIKKLEYKKATNNG